MRELRIAGAGPAGSAAALAALGDGAQVELREKSRFPRHKVCGEFLSPETGAVLDSLGVAGEFAAARPARIRRLVLHVGERTKSCALAEPAYGLSRYALDALLARAAAARGATLLRGETGTQSDVAAGGRSALAAPGNRLFGFKAHFHGPADDAVELFFFSGVYVGLNTVEDGVTNVCGLAPERFLRARGFDFDSIAEACPPLARRLGPLARAMDWIAAGPLSFGRQGAASAPYPAGDALGFVDPFTGTGILNALLTGRLAGLAAARGTAPDEYLRQCRSALARPFEVAALLRKVLRAGWAERLAPLVPAAWLFRLTRPRAVHSTGSAVLFSR